MTTWRDETQTCCLCGANSECNILGSTNTFGSPDLDLRPPPMERDTMRGWFHECSSCHYVSIDLAQSRDDSKSIVESDDYQALIANSDLPPIARRFAMCALLNDHDRQIAGTALLRAAWVCDDEEKAELAKSFRNQSADTIKKLQPFENSDEHATLATILIDVLRRAERFDEATKLANQLLKFKAVKRSEVMQAVVNFQMSLCESQSTAVHLVSDAVETK